MKLTQTDVATVWGGMAGLIADRFLVLKGIAVIDFKKARVLTERTAIQESGGFLFTHVLYTGGAALRAFEELNVSNGYGNLKATLAPENRGSRAFPTGGRREGPSRRARVA